MNNIFCERLREKRIDTGKTQGEIAQLANIKRSTYGEYERGKIMPPVDKIELLAGILNTTPEYLLGWKEEQGKFSRDTEKAFNAFYEEFGSMALTPAEIDRIRAYTYNIRKKIVDFGSVIRSARVKNGMTQEQLAEELKVDLKTVQEYEENKIFPVERLQELYDALKVSIYDLVSLHRFFSSIFEDIYNLQLTEKELKEVYNYAKYIKHQRT